jgi:plastocyanin
VGDSAFEPATLVISGGEAVRIKNTGTGVHSVIMAGIVVAIDVVMGGAGCVEGGADRPRAWSVLILLREDPSIIGTLIVT